MNVVLSCLFLPDRRVLHAPWVGCVEQPCPRGWVVLVSCDTREGEVCQLATMSSIGNSEPFSPEAESITAYLERIQLYFRANAIARDRHMPVFLSLIRSNIYVLLQNLVASESPGYKSFEHLTKCLTDHFDPKPFMIAERFCFHQ